MLGVASIFLLLGLSSLIVGIILPITLQNQLIRSGRDLSEIKADQDSNVWANMPGDRQYSLVHEYEFFEITNPNEYKYGIQPIAKSVGTVSLKETRNVTSAGFVSSEVTTYDGK